MTCFYLFCIQDHIYLTSPFAIAVCERLIALHYSLHWKKIIAIVQSPSHVQLFANPWTRACQVFLTIFWSLLKLIFGIGDAVQPSHHLASSFPSALNLFQHQGLFH